MSAIGLTHHLLLRTKWYKVPWAFLPLVITKYPSVFVASIIVSDGLL